MSTCVKTTVLLLCFACTARLNAQAISAADQKGIETCYNGFMAAFDHMDAATFGSLLTENAEHISPMGELVRGRDNLVAYFGRLFEFFKTQPKPEKFERKNDNWQSRYLSPDLILSTYVSTETITAGGAAHSEKNTLSVLLRKQNGIWLAELITLTPETPMPGAAH
ncbi:MAG: nuclear transport factor 2 family protein [Saprospiraceae bacterium]|nr:nuclear transport factor 2 family protein [Saprospiraceae bacterium]